jgi:hypothetical protein
MNVRLRAVVPAFGAPERLAATVDALERAGKEHGLDIVVLARAGDPVAAALGARAQVLVPGPGVPNTPGAHRHVGAAGATAPLLLFADADVTVEPAFVVDALARFAADPAVVAVGGRIHERQWKAGRLVREIPDLHKSGAGGPVEMVAAAWIARRDAFVAVGGFDPRLPAEEDVELCLRLAARGGRVVALDERAAYHDCAPRPSLAEIRRRFARGLFSGQGLLLRYSWGTPLFARHLWRQRLYLACVAYAGLGVAVALASLLGAGRAADAALVAWGAALALAWALMAFRKRSVGLGGLSVLTWFALGFGIARAWATGRAGREQAA